MNFFCHAHGVNLSGDEEIVKDPNTQETVQEMRQKVITCATVTTRGQDQKPLVRCRHQ